MVETRDLSVSLLIKRSFRLHCPQCGQGKLFASYLRQVDACSLCGASFKGLRADDGPAWLTILVVCHIMVPTLIAVKIYQTWPDWIALPLWLLAAVALTLVLLPRSKAIFIAMLWRNKMLHAGVPQKRVAE